MNKETDDKIEQTLQKYLPPLVKELKHLFSEINENQHSEKCSTLVSISSFFITALAEEASETVLFLINVIGNIARMVMDDAEKCYTKKGVKYMKDKTIEMLPAAFQVCIESMGFDWRKDLAEKMGIILDEPKASVH